MFELVINLHIHTTYSDGSGIYSDLGKAASKTGVEVLLVTDHNVLVQGVNKYYRERKKVALLLAGEEIHDQGRAPQKNHLLVFNVDREMASLATNPQDLINSIKKAGGLSFIAHPFDPALPSFGETDISWEDWNVTGFTGIELWNGFSELKSRVRGKWDAVAYAYFPEFIPQNPLLETINKWDDLTEQGRRVVAVGGSDAHAQHKTLGPLHRIIFPYEYHFSTINTHILTPSSLSGDLAQDRKMVFDALAEGHCFIGNDLPSPTRDFRFSAQGKNGTAIMGDEFNLNGAVTLQVRLPSASEIHLVRNGVSIRKSKGETLLYITDEPGVYRIEAYKWYLGKQRGWIYSNPIYLR